MQWHLLTSPEVESVGEATEVVDHYLQRSRVGGYLRVLQSGWSLAKTTFGTLKKRAAISVNVPIARGLMFRTRRGRQLPALAADLLFTGVEPALFGDYAGLRAARHRKAWGRRQTW